MRIYCEENSLEVGPRRTSSNKKICIDPGEKFEKGHPGSSGWPFDEHDVVLVG
jgi:hypothetical protein